MEGIIMKTQNPVASIFESNIFVVGGVEKEEEESDHSDEVEHDDDQKQLINELIMC